MNITKEINEISKSYASDLIDEISNLNQEYTFEGIINIITTTAFKLLVVSMSNLRHYDPEKLSEYKEHALKEIQRISDYVEAEFKTKH